MEMASYLAGETWSDHPRCTNPTLALLAREVNDRVDDDHRRLLAPMVPDVVGIGTTDPLAPTTVARACALAGLDAGVTGTRAQAVGLLRCEAVFNGVTVAGEPMLSSDAEAALAARPVERAWAERFVAAASGAGYLAPLESPLDHHSASVIVGAAVTGLAAVPGGSARLVDLLRSAITSCRSAAAARAGDVACDRRQRHPFPPRSDAAGAS
ncbi:hypothetical protein [Nocardioides terrisoli]|uniref:hypothetical protein n=1 Tax=Nocardioides terrisoli TaxID=3388267 RepID=UPI00287BB5F4|nr:hypothetical protein [Nocardioides marmorisolisilvae]